MHTAIKARSRAVAAGISEVVELSIADRTRLRDLTQQLLRRHVLLGLRSVVSSEEIVEAYFRCAITGTLTGQYDLSTAAIPNCINSSHRAVRCVCAWPAHCHGNIEDKDWRRGWLAMQRNHPEVNVRVPGHGPKRADLYLIARDGVVSIEFKYVGVAGVRDVAACAAQLGRHAEHHAEAILVLYSDTPVPQQTVHQLTQKTGRVNVRILNPTGPKIDVARGAPRNTD
jgi:hypothetical protein